MKKYTSPKITITSLSNESIITKSGLAATKNVDYTFSSGSKYSASALHLNS